MERVRERWREEPFIYMPSPWFLRSKGERVIGAHDEMVIMDCSTLPSKETEKPSVWGDNVGSTYNVWCLIHTVMQLPHESASNLSREGKLFSYDTIDCKCVWKVGAFNFLWTDWYMLLINSISPPYKQIRTGFPLKGTVFHLAHDDGDFLENKTEWASQHNSI